MNEILVGDVGIELNPEYAAIAERRIAAVDPDKRLEEFLPEGL